MVNRSKTTKNHPKNMYSKKVMLARALLLQVLQNTVTLTSKDKNSQPIDSARKKQDVRKKIIGAWAKTFQKLLSASLWMQPVEAGIGRTVHSHRQHLAGAMQLRESCVIAKGTCQKQCNWNSEFEWTKLKLYTCLETVCLRRRCACAVPANLSWPSGPHKTGGSMIGRWSYNISE